MSSLQRIEYRAKVAEIGDINLELSRIAFENKKQVIILNLAIAFEAMMFLVNRCLEKIKLELSIHLKEWIMITLATGCLVAYGIFVHYLSH